MEKLGIKPENILADQEDYLIINGVKARKGTIAAVLQNAAILSSNNATQEQKQAAKILEIDQPKISALIRGRLRSFSLERLIHFLNELGQNVSIMISPTKSKSERGHTWISESYSNTRIAALGR